jgi:transcriptional regulator with XRE-family HTH domain
MQTRSNKKSPGAAAGPAAPTELVNFSRNLKLLCGFYSSISEVCRRLDINRTQFNRYLAGGSRPSEYLLNRIADFFSVARDSLFLPPEKFRLMVEARPRSTSTAPLPFQRAVELLQAASRSDIQQYFGFYYDYYFSMAEPGQVLRAFVHIFPYANGVYYKRFERIPSKKRSKHFVCKYLGTAFFLSDRLFLVDYESLTRNEITLSVYYPTYRVSVSSLAGVKLGVAANDQRQMKCARSIMESLGKTTDTRRALGSCGLFPPDHKSIPSWVIEMIDNSRPLDPFHFIGVPL